MSHTQPRGLLALSILEILREFSDEDHRLSQKEIATLLLSERGIRVERKAIKRQLMDLVAYGCPLEYAVVSRSGRDGEPEEITTDWYMAHEFSPAELRLLMDSLLFSRHAPPRQADTLMIKLQKLNSRYFSSRIRHAVRLPPRGTAQAQQLFLTIEVLDEAISQGLQVRFRYLTYGPDKEPRPRTDRRGRPIDYLVNPYQLVAANGRYYLVGNHDRHQDLSYLRVDRITDIQLSDRPRKPLSSLPGYERGLDLPRHTLAHPYMFSGPSALVRFEADATLMDDLIDWFGTDIGVSQLSEQTLEVTVAVNLAAMRIWALQYGRFVRVLSPDSLVEELRQDRRSMAKRYGV